MLSFTLMNYFTMTGRKSGKGFYLYEGKKGKREVRISMHTSVVFSFVVDIKSFICLA